MSEYLEYQSRCQSCGSPYSTTIEAIAKLELCEQCRKESGVGEHAEPVGQRFDEWDWAEWSREEERLNEKGRQS